MSLDRTQPVTILLVEDNPDHAELTQRALESGGMPSQIVWARDGEEALDFLYRRGAWADSGTPRPGLILLDVKLPKVDGHKVLRQIKQDPDLQRIPIVMLTTSERDDEVSDAFRAGANSWVTKPVRFTEFMEKVKTVKLYWLLTNRLPD
jgi:two-component system response regulator